MTQYRALANEDRVIVNARKCMHRFGEGYEPTGPSRVVYEGSHSEARELRDLLDEVLPSDV